MNPPNTHYQPQQDHSRKIRLEHQLRRLGDRNPACSCGECTERDPFALTGLAPDVVCYEHQAAASGRAATEHHHLAGEANDPVTTAEIPGNDHRVLSDLQHSWPVETLRNPAASPLLRAAAAIRGWLDVLWLILTRAVNWIAGFLERLDVLLAESLGAQWWLSLGVEVEQ